MIHLTEKTKQDFLSPEWCKKLTDSGIDMSIDAKYWLIPTKEGYDIDGPMSKELIDDVVSVEVSNTDKWIPTYTLPEILYKLDEYPFKNNKGAPIRMIGGWKDAPFYGFFFDYKASDDDENPYEETKNNYSEYPLYAAAQLLLWSKQNGLYYVKDVSRK